MTIFTLTILAHTIPPFLIILILVGLFYLAQIALYQAGINWLELRARWHNQTLDYRQRQLALAMPKQNLIEWANWYMAHQHDIEVDLLPDRVEK